MRKWLRRAALFLTILIIAVLVTAAILNHFWTRELEAQVAAVTSEGGTLIPFEASLESLPRIETMAGLDEEDKCSTGDVGPCWAYLGGFAAEQDKIEKLVLGRQKTFAKVVKALSRPDFMECQGKGSMLLLSQEIAAAAVYRAHKGENRQAAGYIRTILSLARINRGEYSFAAQHIYLAWASFKRSRLDLAPEEWRQLGRAFVEAALVFDYSRAIHEERAQGFLLIQSLTLPIMRKKDCAAYLRVMNRLVTLSKNPFYTAREEESRVLAQAEGERSWCTPRTNSWLQMIACFHTVWAAHKAELEIARTICELKAAGSYPQKLDLTDPFTGRPMIYRREGLGFRLYSVGPNLEDDNGGGDDIGIVMN